MDWNGFGPPGPTRGTFGPVRGTFGSSRSRGGRGRGGGNFDNAQHMPTGPIAGAPPPGVGRGDFDNSLPGLERFNALQAELARISNGQPLPPFQATQPSPLTTQLLPHPHPQPTLESLQHFPVQFPNDQYVSPLEIFGEPPVSFPDTGFPHAHGPFPDSGYQDVLHSSGFGAIAPRIHEGYIPAPGADDEFDDTYDDHTPFQSQNWQSEDETDSDDERALIAEEERIQREIADKIELQEAEDSDFSLDGMGEFDEDPDEQSMDELVHENEATQVPQVEEEEEEEEEAEDGEPTTARKRGRPPGRPRGRPSGRVRGGRPRGTGTRKEGQKGKSGWLKGKRGPRPIADPGPKFKELQRTANDLYLQKDYPGAIEYANKAIQMNPEIFVTHSLLSEIYAEMGEEQKSVEALLVGAPTKRDKELWYHIIDRIKDMDEEKYPLFTDETKQAMVLDCLQSIILLDTKDYEARSQRLEIESALGNVSRCVKLCRKMLTQRPEDDDVLKQMARLGTSSAKQTKIHLERIIISFDTSIAFFLANDKPSESNLDWSLLNIYLDLLDRSGDYDRGLARARSLSRWIQGRNKETYWDDQQDDREFDIADDPRRTAVPEFKRTFKSAKYGVILPFEIRVKIGMFRLRQEPSNFSEAMNHFNVLEPDDDGPNATVLDYPDLFREVADALHTSGHHEDALRFYEPLYNNESKELGLRSFMKFYSSHKILGHTEMMDELMPIFQKWKTDTLEDLAGLAKFFEDMGMDDDATKRAESVFKNGGRRFLQKVGFRGFDDVHGAIMEARKKARNKYEVRKKARKRTYKKKLDKPTTTEKERGATTEELLLVERPREGYFKTTKTSTENPPEAFLPEEPEPKPKTFAGTNLPVDAIERRLFRKMLTALADGSPDELKAARAQHREIVASFERLDEISEAAEDGDEDAMLEFVSIARELVEEFSSFDLFYFDRREDFKGYFRRIGSGELWKVSALMVLAIAANNVEDGEEEPEIKRRPDSAPRDFWGVHFERWLDAFIQYAICLARLGEDDCCFNVLDVAGQSNIFFRSQDYTHRFQICRLACALTLDDSMEASTAVRWLMRTYPFSSDIFRLFSSANRLCSVPDGFATGASMKMLMRYIKTMDYALLTPEERTWYNFRGNDHTAWMAKAVSEQLSTHVRDHDPTLFLLYAYVLTCGGSYQAALNYYFRAFTITPDDPSLNLAIGLAYIQHAVKRLSENRQYQIQQGLSFVYRYYEIRTKDNVAIWCSEAEFNIGRVWHSLGLVSQALPAYRRCIALAQRVCEEAKRTDRNEGGDEDVDMDMDEARVEDFSTEAAFSIQSIYALSGNFEAARKVTEEVLVIE